MPNYYLCIDLKSFYASVECVERGLNPLTTNLVVADPSRGKGAICLAITPAMKALGIKNRCRIFDIPKNISYITAIPQMQKYMETSAKIYKIYLRYFAKDDIHVYSIDECFIDVTNYLHLYQKTPKELGKMLLGLLVDELGLYATCGIGTNLFLAKVALDVTAKHSPDFIGFLDEESFKEKIWYHEPITDIWNISTGIARRLARFGAYNLHDVALLKEEILYREFGINAELLIDHANGIETCTMADIKAYKSKSNSHSNSQILFTDYNFEDAYTVLKEMIDVNVLDLVDKGLVCDSISLAIAYSKDGRSSANGLLKLGKFTSSLNELQAYFKKLYYKITDEEQMIRRISISFNNLVSEEYASIDLFTDSLKLVKEQRMQHAIIDLKKRYGKNSVLKGLNYTEKATQRMRNKLIGGHNAIREDDQDA